FGAAPHLYSGDTFRPIFETDFETELRLRLKRTAPRITPMTSRLSLTADRGGTSPAPTAAVSLGCWPWLSSWCPVLLAVPPGSPGKSSTTLMLQVRERLAAAHADLPARSTSNWSSVTDVWAMRASGTAVRCQS